MATKMHPRRPRTIVCRYGRDMTIDKRVARARWRDAWVIEARIPQHRREDYPQLVDGAPLALLPRRTPKAAIEAVLVALVQTHALESADDRFDFAVDEAPYVPEANACRRLYSLDYNGAPEFVATLSTVRMFHGELEVRPQPWPKGQSAESFAATHRNRML